MRITLRLLGVAFSVEWGRGSAEETPLPDDAKGVPVEGDPHEGLEVEGFGFEELEGEP